MIDLETHYLADDGHAFPNSRLPVVIFRGALRADAPVMERAFADNGWSNAWRNGVFGYHHFHSITHEVLGIAEGEVKIAFGGPDGAIVAVGGGDVVVIPAGVAHCNAGQSDDLLIVGAYPGGHEWDICRGDPADYRRAKAAAAAVSAYVPDPLGEAGLLREAWRPSRNDP